MCMRWCDYDKAVGISFLFVAPIIVCVHVYVELIILDSVIMARSTTTITNIEYRIMLLTVYTLYYYCLLCEKLDSY